ncbi:lysylphosphatidylglycerol synthase transmembrane domain-containing protein [Leifsonia sp. EB34]|uniref:lysylphosphatidylglycerol synthase transmembrane domain-containing protein n=1 Tax=Leifsonia sp. EB34 TaxID=3156303 RepID=UPI003515F74F
MTVRLSAAEAAPTPTAVSHGLRRALGRPWVRITLRTLIPVAILIAIVARVGTGPFLRGLLSLDGPTVAAAFALTALATVAAAWRWRLIAGRLGVGLRWSTAIGAYYRSQFVNTVLPGGVVGDVQRAVDHGRRADRLGAAARAVALERLLGQAVQVTLAVVVLAVVGMEFEGVLLPALGVVLTAVVVGGAATAFASRRVRRALAHEWREVREGLGSVSVSVRAVIASVIVCACHLGTFAIAAVAVGADVPPLRLLALGMVVLIAASLPFTLGGWGPREGAAGWAFAMAGFGAAAGLSAATLYGVLAFVCFAPAALVVQSAAVLTRRRMRA